jgi:serine/threonine-protein kinase RsbW
MIDSDTPGASGDGFFRKLVLPARFSSLETVRVFVVQAAEDSGMEAKTVFSIELAVDEAFSNIIEHAYGGESHEQVECSCRSTEDRLIIMLKDCGKPINPDIIPEPNLDASLEERRIGGLGMHFMRQLMDEVNFTFSKGPDNRENCNVLTMVKFKES